MSFKEDRKMLILEWDEKIKKDFFSFNVTKPRLLLLLLLSHFQSGPTLCDTIDSSPSGSPVPGILQARTLDWVAISFSSAWKWKVKVKSLSRVWLFSTPWTVAHKAPLSMGFSRQEYWSGVPMPFPKLRLRVEHLRPQNTNIKCLP